MTPTPDSNAETVLRDFARRAAQHLGAAPTETVQDFEIGRFWERGPDGHFRERSKRKPSLMRVLNQYQLVAGYGDAVKALKADPLIGRHLDRMVGTEFSATRIEADNIVWSLLYATANDDSGFEFTDEHFDRRWQELLGFCKSERFLAKAVAPIPYLTVASFPLQLNDELMLDRLTEDEVARCCQVGVLPRVAPDVPLVTADIAVGVRKTTWVRKVIQEDDQSTLTEARNQGSFGRRPRLHDHLTVDDVLSGLRLFKGGRVRASGYATWIDFPWLSSGISYRPMGQWPVGGRYDLTEQEVPRFLELWRQLQEGAGDFTFAIHRFNLAFEKGLIEDRIVDLVIAAESLFLRDVGSQYRGELRFRFALRAAKFIKHAAYTEHGVYKMMLSAYDARSSIVHGGSPKNKGLPDDASADFATFVDRVEELVRLALRKALSMEDRGALLRRAEYWEALIFGANGGPGAQAI